MTKGEKIAAAMHQVPTDNPSLCEQLNKDFAEAIDTWVSKPGNESASKETFLSNGPARDSLHRAVVAALVDRFLGDTRPILAKDELARIEASATAYENVLRKLALNTPKELADAAKR